MSRVSRLTPSIYFALAISIIVHALLAVALALYLGYAPAPDELAQLDLTSVDLSFAETVEETAAAVASAPSAPVEATKAPPPTPKDEAVASPRPVDAVPPPHLTDAKLPSPEDRAELLPPVVIKQESKVERQETRDARPARVASAPRQARVDAPPKPRRSIRPDYPRESRLRGEHGDVSLELDVTADGSVGNVRILKSPGYPLLEEAAVKAARNARFAPAKADGRPVASTVRLTLNFKLR